MIISLERPHYSLDEVKECIQKEKFDMWSPTLKDMNDLGFHRSDLKEYFLKQIKIRHFHKSMIHKKYEGTKKISPYLYCMVDVYKSLFQSKPIYTKFCMIYHSGKNHPDRPENLKEIQRLIIQSFKPDESWR